MLCCATLCHAMLNAAAFVRPLDKSQTLGADVVPDEVGGAGLQRQAVGGRGEWGGQNV